MKNMGVSFQKQCHKAKTDLFKNRLIVLQSVFCKFTFLAQFNEMFIEGSLKLYFKMHDSDFLSSMKADFDKIRKKW